MEAVAVEQGPKIETMKGRDILDEARIPQNRLPDLYEKSVRGIKAELIETPRFKKDKPDQTFKIGGYEYRVTVTDFQGVNRPPGAMDKQMTIWRRPAEAEQPNPDLDETAVYPEKWILEADNHNGAATYKITYSDPEIRRLMLNGYNPTNKLISLLKVGELIVALHDARK